MGVLEGTYDSMMLMILHTFFAASDPGASIAVRDLAPIITAVAGGLTGFFSAKRTEKSDKLNSEKAELSALLQGYNSQMATYSTMVEALEGEVVRMRLQHEEDRKLWVLERAELTELRDRFKKRISDLEEEVSELKKATS